MKKYFILFVMMVLSLNMIGQQMNYKVKGTFTMPESEKYVKLDFDFSKTVFEKKYSEADWAILNGEKEWESAKQEALEMIVEQMNKEMNKTRIILIIDKMNAVGGKKVETNYTLFVVPRELNKKGKNKSDFILINTATGEALGYVATSGSGAHFGSLGNMLGEGYEDSAPAIAKLIEKQNKIKK